MTKDELTRKLEEKTADLEMAEDDADFLRGRVRQLRQEKEKLEEDWRPIVKAATNLHDWMTTADDADTVSEEYALLCSLGIKKAEAAILFYVERLNGFCLPNENAIDGGE